MMKRIINNQIKFKERIFIAVMLIVPVGNFLVFWLYVNFNSILMAFQRPGLGGTIEWGFENFRLFVNDLGSENSVLLLALKNTLLFFTSNLLIVLPISLLLCYFIYKKIALYKFYRFVFYLPCIISSSVLVIIFKYIIATNGVLGKIFDLLGKTPPALLHDPETAIWTILFYTVFMGFGGNMILLSGSMAHIDASIIEAGKLDGVKMRQEIFYLVIPLIWPTLSTMIILAFTGLFGASGPILAFTEGQAQTTTLSYWIYDQVRITGEYYYPSAVGLIMTLIGTPIALGMRYLLNKTLDTVES